MLLSIHHRTELGYTEPVSESVMELRMMPLNSSHQTLRTFELAVGPQTPLFEHVDWLGNHAHHFSIVDAHDKVEIVAAASVEMHPKKVALEQLSERCPLPDLGHRYQDFLLSHGAVARDPRLVAFAEQAGLLGDVGARAVLACVTERLRELLTYKKGATTSATSVSDALDVGKGVCQDYAHVGLSLLRMLGIPARYVSGYLFRPEAAELETHAWIEAFLPGAGWIGLDPTHAGLAGASHVAVAVGRSYADVPPNRGVYRGDAEERIEVRVQIEKVEGDAAPRRGVPVRPDARLLYEHVRRERRLDLNALEQQRQQQQ